MASAITLKGIDRAVSQLGYTNENTLKYRFIQYIRNYYVDDHSLASLNKIDHSSMIKLLWDTHDDPEIIKNKKKNLNSLRSSVNADLKKLYKKGLNPEGIKIGSDNIFVMSEDAKDTILNSYGYDLQPDVTLKIDQIMDILKLASQTLAGALGVEDTTTEDGLRKKDQLKDLIKGLSERLGLGDPEYPKPGAGSRSQPYESQVSSDDIGNEGNIEAVDEDKIISETADIEDEELLEEVADFKEDEILDDIEDTDEQDILEDADEDILDDVEDVIIDVVEDVDPKTDVEEEALDEDIEDVAEEDTEFGYVDVEEDEHICGNVLGKPGDESGTCIEDISEGLSREQGLGQGEGRKSSDATGLIPGDLNAGFEAGDKVSGEEIAFAMGKNGDEHEAGFGEMNGDFDGAAPDAVDQIMELDESDEIESIDEEDISDDVEDIITDVTEDLNPEMEVEDIFPEDDIEDVTEADTGLEYVDVEEDVHVGGDVLGKPGDESETCIEDISEGLSREQGLGQGKTGYDRDEQEAMAGDLIAGIEGGDKSGGEGISFDAEGKRNESGFCAGEVNEVLDDAVPDAMDEITELDDLEEIESIDEEEISDDIEDIVMGGTGYSGLDTGVEADVPDEDIKNITEPDTELDYVDVVDENPVDNHVGGVPSEVFGTGGNDQEKEVEQLGLPIDSLGQDYGSGKGVKLKKERLLAEAFDGYLGSIDRYYNHYILIDGGEYSVGSRYPKRDEKAEQIVRLSPFYLGKFPVTNGLFEIFVEKTGYRTTAEKVGNGTVYYGRFKKKIDNETGRITSRWNASLYCKVVKGACWYHPTGPESTIHNKRNHPVVQISLEDAAAFAAWTGKRLPTENEWEAASRTANGWIFPWGEEWKNDACNIEESGIADTTPVDKYIEFENDFGIVDVLGNVLEWTSDGFKVAARENYETITQIAKGGSWVSGNDICLYSRFKIAPDSYSNVLGFRCVAY